MSDGVEYVVVISGTETMAALAAGLNEIEVDADVAELQGLGGSIDEWMIAGTVASHVVARLLKAVHPFVDGRRIKSIKAGDIEIVRPRPEDVAKVLDLLAKQPER
ncbi:hypothetical protein GCM10009839_08010 [Catenulispora yoronensis]|uniref:Uncharacterized protein n=1 Tax=Catenulispora yoronensis TaxID=450799 RepID=A0ABP5F2N8_9ACTN